MSEQDILIAKYLLFVWKVQYFSYIILPLAFFKILEIEMNRTIFLSLALRKGANLSHIA